MRIKEAPLILLTLLSQTAIGLTVFSTTFYFFYPQIDLFSSFKPVLASFVILSSGLLFSVFHLGHPLKGYRSLNNLKASWISREIIMFGIYGFFLIIDLVIRLNNSIFALIPVAATLSGVLALCASAKVYKNPGFPALNNKVPLIFFLTSSFILGVIVFDKFANTIISSKISSLLMLFLIIGLIVHIIVPFLWLQDTNKVIQATGKAHLKSALFWARIVLEFCLPVLLLIIYGQVSFGIIILIFIGEFFGRTMFFNCMIHTSENIGQIYSK